MSRPDGKKLPTPDSEGEGESKRTSLTKAILTDATKCIGCERCVQGCVQQNDLPPDYPARFKTNDGLSGARLTSIMEIPGKDPNTSRFVRRQCMHCVDPTCAAACLVGALTKRADGPVHYDADKCIGCRYCFQACPFKVPRFDFEKRVTRKCHMCYDRIPLLDYMKPACVAACPVGALHFGYKSDIIREAKRRAQRRGGAGYIMGLAEAGGTDMLTVLPTRPQDLSLVVAPRKIVNHNLDKIRITAAGFMGASGVACLLYLYAALTRGTDKEGHDSQQ